MELKKLAEYKNILIQCHDAPDADSIGSGFALASYLRDLGRDPKLVYGGPSEISKPDLLMLISELGISISREERAPEGTGLLITVDCQRGAGNVSNFEVPGAAFFVIDHHRPEIPEGGNTIIRPELASCSTLVWDLLKRDGYDPGARALTALFYGLYSDTNGLSELRHPLDRDLAEVPRDAGLVRRLKNSSITMEGLDVIADCLKNRVLLGGIALFEARECDSNLLGFASDIAQKTAGLDCCIVWSPQPQGLKLSVRTSVREIMAGEIAGFFCRGTGSGGGAVEKAGGFMNYKAIRESGGRTPFEYLCGRVEAYNKNYDLIYAGNNKEDFASMTLYRKLQRPCGFARSTDVFPQGARITVRTLEGDLDITAGEDIFIMTGIAGEVYPIKKARFYESYRETGEPFKEKREYEPSVISRADGSRRPIGAFTRLCYPKDAKLIRARELLRDTKIFTSWDTGGYFYAAPGSFLAANEDDYGDCYALRRDIFLSTYEPL